MATQQPLPIEIQNILEQHQAVIAQCDGELLSLQAAVSGWTARRQAAVRAIAGRGHDADVSVTVKVTLRGAGPEAGATERVAFAAPSVTAPSVAVADPAIATAPVDDA
mgnify:CR=1 FL=1